MFDTSRVLQQPDVRECHTLNRRAVFILLSCREYLLGRAKWTGTDEEYDEIESIIERGLRDLWVKEQSMRLIYKATTGNAVMGPSTYQIMPLVIDYSDGVGGSGYSIQLQPGSYIAALALTLDPGPDPGPDGVGFTVQTGLRVVGGALGLRFASEMTTPRYATAGGVVSIELDETTTYEWVVRHTLWGRQLDTVENNNKTMVQIWRLG